MKRIKSFKLFENKDPMDLIKNINDLIQNLWDNCRDLEYFDKGYGLTVQAYIESGDETEWFLDTSFDSDVTPENFTWDLNNWEEVESAYLSGSKPHLRFGVISAYDGEDHHDELLLDQTNKIYDIAKRELTNSDIELVKLGIHDSY
jgi:hypothetical protein